MHYSEKLMREIRQKETCIEDTVQLINDFRGHLISPKFHQDTTIQVRDVEARLVQILNKLTEVQ